MLREVKLRQVENAVGELRSVLDKLEKRLGQGNLTRGEISNFRFDIRRQHERLESPLISLTLLMEDIEEELPEDTQA